MHQALLGFAHGYKTRIPRFGLLSLPCPVLHRIAFAVVSGWCQEHVSFRVNRLFLKRFVDHSPSAATSDYEDQALSLHTLPCPVRRHTPRRPDRAVSLSVYEN
jgi:hypothetical protein